MDTKGHEAVAGVGDPGPNGSTETAIIPTGRDYNFPNSRKVYIKGKLHPDYSRAVPRNLAVADEIHERRDRNERAGARLRYQRAVGRSRFSRRCDTRSSAIARKMDSRPRRCGRIRRPDSASRSMMAVFRRFMRVPRSRNAERPTPNAPTSNGQKRNGKSGSDLSTLNP